MKNNVKLIGLCLIVIITAALMPGCDSRKIATTRELPQCLDELSLTGMWSAVSDKADIQDDSAKLGTFHLNAGPDGKIDSLSFGFQGKNKKEIPCFYLAEMGREGKIDIREYEGEPFSLFAHPMDVFTEVDKLGLASLEPGETGFAMAIDFHSGNISCSYDQHDIYHLEGGELLPLKEFHSTAPGCFISVAKVYPVEEEEGSTVNSVTAGRTHQVWFLSEDINRAEIVEYLDYGQKANYDDFVLGIQSVLPEGWKMELIAQEGLMVPPHGLNEPLFRIDFVDRTHQFEAQGGQMRFPSLRLYFYDIQGKGAVLEAIEQKKIYSWDIPDYFDESAEYIVVTSPLYINGGCFSNEAITLYEPLEKVLKDYFNTTPNFSPLVQQTEEIPSLQIVSLTSPVRPGVEASLATQTIPGAECYLTIDYGLSGISTLPRKTADGSGRVSWTWTALNFRGVWQVEVRAGYGGKTASQYTLFTIE